MSLKSSIEFYTTNNTKKCLLVFAVFACNKTIFLQSSRIKVCFSVELVLV